jgi:acetoin utilization protein AcuB
MSEPLFEIKVRELMSPKVFSIGIDVQVDVAIELMARENIRRLPVLGKADQLKGIITMEDARGVMPKGISFYEAGPEDTEVPKVRKAMSHGLITVGADDSVGKAAQLLMHHEIGALPVLSNAGELVGILTESDIFKYVARGLPPIQAEEDFE